MQKKDKIIEDCKKYKEEKYIEDKVRRDERKKILKKRLIEINKEEIEKRKDILNYHAEVFYRSFHKSINRGNACHINMKKSLSCFTNTIRNQIALQSNMSIFNKQLNILKSQSVFKKSWEERMKMYKEIKRKEAERIKREKEDELFNKTK